MKALTLNELYIAIRDEIIKGNGKKTVLVADDDEGNGYHPIYFAVTGMDNFDVADLEWCNMHGVSPKEAKENCIVIG